jgi:hypothetical protein
VRFSIVVISGFAVTATVIVWTPLDEPLPLLPQADRPALAAAIATAGARSRTRRG